MITTTTTNHRKTKVINLNEKLSSKNYWSKTYVTEANAIKAVNDLLKKFHNYHMVGAEEVYCSTMVLKNENGRYLPLLRFPDKFASYAIDSAHMGFNVI